LPIPYKDIMAYDILVVSHFGRSPQGNGLYVIPKSGIRKRKFVASVFLDGPHKIFIYFAIVCKVIDAFAI
jgi:hypothetical protein